jgi:DNA (cytosine-5)-methyltransferase 1
MSKIKVVELFAGVGGFRLGFEGKNGMSPSSGYREPMMQNFETVWANQFEPSTKRQHAAEIYKARFGESGFNGSDINEVDTESIPNHDLLVGGFPCFTNRTMILTEHGYKHIDKIQKGDIVLTHLGRWRKVTAVMSRKDAQTLIVRGQGFPDIHTTEEHPFWSCEKISDRPRKFSDPRWVETKSIKPSLTYLSQILPRETTKIMNESGWSNDFWWIVGRYLADGWLVSGKKRRVVICSSLNEGIEVEERIRRIFHCTSVTERTVMKFHICVHSFHDFLVQFGHGADGKLLPSWVFNISSEYAASLLEGYSTGDGQKWQGRWRATTVSRALALSVALLAQRAYGVIASIHEVEVPSTKIIEGRVVNQKKQYQIVVPPRNRSGFISDDYGWKLVRSVKSGKKDEVFNISVEEDESYIADGCVVHNCQDYSVANSLKNSSGLFGKKGVLWWSIHRILSERKQRPNYLFFENVDRLINSPSKQRGRDFAIILRSLADLGYAVEWRIINSADYGMPQRRKRTYILGYLRGSSIHDEMKQCSPSEWITEKGLFNQAFPIESSSNKRSVDISGDMFTISSHFNKDGSKRMFENSGMMIDGQVTTMKTTPAFNGPHMTLGDVLLSNVSNDFFLSENDIPKWKELKGAKSLLRKTKEGFEYEYSEGGMSFPDDLNKPSRTIITGEGGPSASRFKHVVEVDGGLRRLSPIELERLNMFPDGHTEHDGIVDTKRAFFMGNAMVVGVVEKVGGVLANRVKQHG